MVGAVGVLSIGESDTDLLLKGLKDAESETQSSVQLSQIPGIFETQRLKYEEKIADLERLLQEKKDNNLDFEFMFTNLSDKSKIMQEENAELSQKIIDLQSRLSHVESEISD